MAEPESFGRYTVKERLGRGAMGVVYLAEDPVIGREVAIKVVQMPPGASEKEREEMQARFEREFRSAGTLSHPNIVTIHDVGQEGDHAFIAMEFIRGRSLQEIVHSKEILSFKDISDIVFQMCSALDYAHERGIIHRDIKPANILMTRDGQAKLTDFGVAKLATGTLTRTGTIIGTPAYMSPEQVQGHTATPASDQFSVAIVLYEMLTGELPFSGDSPTTIMYKIVHEDPINPHELNRSLPERIDRILMRALDKAPESRYGSCTEFAEAVREGLGAAPMTTTVAYTPSSDEADAIRADSAAGDPGGPTGEAEGEGRGLAAFTTSRAIWFGAATVIAALVLGFVGWQVWQAVSPVTGDTEDLTATAGPGAGEALPGPAATGEIDPGSAGEESDGDPGATGDEGTSQDASGDAAQRDTGEGTGQGTGPAGTGNAATGADAGTGEAGEESDPGPGDPATEGSATAPSSREFTIVSDPAGATVTLDGEELDQRTPATVTLRDGQRHRLSVALEGYKPEGMAPFTLDDLRAGQIATQELRFVLESAAPPGRIIIDAPFEVEVSLDDGQRYGPGESHEIELPAGSYDMTLSAPSVFYEERRTVEVGNGDEKTLNLPALYQVRIVALPVTSICRVFIDGRPAGIAPLSSLSITRGYHEFRWVWSSPRQTEKTERILVDSQDQRITGSYQEEASRR